MSQPKDVGAKKTSGRPGPSGASRKRYVTADSTPCQSDHPGRGLDSSVGEERVCPEWSYQDREWKQGSGGTPNCVKLDKGKR